MPLFVCDLCLTIENTGAGFYWSRNIKNLWSDAALQGKALCSECAPTSFKDGSPNKRGGAWHNRFKKQIATPLNITLAGPDRFVYFGPFENQFENKDHT